MQVVSNTSPLSALSIIGRLRLLRTQFGTIRISKAIWIQLSSLSLPIIPPPYRAVDCHPLTEQLSTPSLQWPGKHAFITRRSQWHPLVCHTRRIRRSLYWQRTPDDDCSHLTPAEFDEADDWWMFSITTSRQTIDSKFPLHGPVVRPASNQMLLERWEERQWLAYARLRLEWTRNLSLDPDVAANILSTGHICRLRLLHYWQIPECRQLFISSKSIATLFCTPGLLSELDETSPLHWPLFRQLCRDREK